jgi:hypothetical protein
MMRLMMPAPRRVGAATPILKDLIRRL